MIAFDVAAARLLADHRQGRPEAPRPSQPAAGPRRPDRPRRRMLLPLWTDRQVRSRWDPRSRGEARTRDRTDQSRRRPDGSQRSRCCCREWRCRGTSRSSLRRSMRLGCRRSCRTCPWTGTLSAAANRRSIAGACPCAAHRRAPSPCPTSRGQRWLTERTHCTSRPTSLFTGIIGWCTSQSRDPSIGGCGQPSTGHLASTLTSVSPWMKGTNARKQSQRSVAP
jgi:hypothetical protein